MVEMQFYNCAPSDKKQSLLSHLNWAYSNCNCKVLSEHIAPYKQCLLPRLKCLQCKVAINFPTHLHSIRNIQLWLTPETSVWWLLTKIMKLCCRPRLHDFQCLTLHCTASYTPLLPLPLQVQVGWVTMETRMVMQRKQEEQSSQMSHGIKLSSQIKKKSFTSRCRHSLLTYSSTQEESNIVFSFQF